MKKRLQARRQKLVRELDQVNRKILAVQKGLSEIESQLVARQQASAKAA